MALQLSARASNRCQSHFTCPPLAAGPSFPSNTLWTDIWRSKVRAFFAAGLGQALLLTGLPMPPIKDETVDSLRDLVHKLESRVQQLEAKLDGSGGGSAQSAKSDGPSIRIILMGPPGAGTENSVHRSELSSADPDTQARGLKHQRSKRNTAPVIW